MGYQTIEVVGIVGPVLMEPAQHTNFMGLPCCGVVVRWIVILQWRPGLPTTFRPYFHVEIEPASAFGLCMGRELEKPTSR